MLLITLAQLFPSPALGLALPPSEEMLELARRAVEYQQRCRNEDIEEWAKRLAADVANAND